MRKDRKKECVEGIGASLRLVGSKKEEVASAPKSGVSVERKAASSPKSDVSAKQKAAFSPKSGVSA